MLRRLSRHLVPRSIARSSLVCSAAVLAILSASCCVLPIGLSILGLGGTWLALLGPFVAYRSLILLAAAVVIAWAWFRILRSPKPARWGRGVLAVTIVATLSLVTAVSAPLWERQATRAMLDYWRANQ